MVLSTEFLDALAKTQIKEGFHLLSTEKICKSQCISYYMQCRWLLLSISCSSGHISKLLHIWGGCKNGTRKLTGGGTKAHIIPKDYNSSMCNPEPDCCFCIKHM